MQITFIKCEQDFQECQLIYKDRLYIGYGYSKDSEVAQRMALSNALSNLPEYLRHHLDYIDDSK